MSIAQGDKYGNGRDVSRLELATVMYAWCLVNSSEPKDAEKAAEAFRSVIQLGRRG